ncbi:MAG: protein kinase [Thermoanaerobaculaceae bacterium]
MTWKAKAMGDREQTAAATTVGDAADTRETALPGTSPRQLQGEPARVTATPPPLGPQVLPLELPARWGRFAVTELLGRGGMGRVYRAYDPTLERQVALKILVGDDPVHVERFQREARTQAGVDHPAVCKVFEVGDVGGVPYIAMQLVRGRTLEKVAAGLSIAQRVALVRQAAEGVHAAHRTGLIHRDIKPANILVEEVEGGGLLPYVVDFGLARLLDEPGLTHTFQVAGTPSYMAPEQAAGRTAQADRRTDVWGLGATLYELLTGRPPFTGNSVVVVMAHVVNDDPHPLRTLNDAVPRDLETIVLRCLDKEPSRRYQSAHELAEELGRWLDGEPIHSRRSSVFYRLRTRARKHKLVVAALAVAAAALLATAVVVARASWYAREEARIAGELGREVEGIEAVLRHSMMLPRHDVTPDLAAARARVSGLAERLPGLGRAARGPGQYALGRGYLALGEHERALEHLRKAWDAGFRGPQVAYALGVTWARLYETQLGAAQRIPNRSVREQRLAEINVKYRDPASRFLSASRGAPGVAPELVEARLKLFEERWDEAVELCRTAGSRLPWLYEAPALEGKVAAERHIAFRIAGRREDALAALDRMHEAYGRAEAVARSAPAVFEGYCREQRFRIEALPEGGGDVEAAAPAAVTACTVALEVLPTSDAALADLAHVHWLVAGHRMSRGRDPRAALTESIELARRGAELHPSNPNHDNALGLAYSSLGEYQRRQGEDPRPSYELARASFEKALAADPNAYYPLNNVALSWGLIGAWEQAHGLDPIPSYTRAIEWYDRAIAVDSRIVLAFSNKGSALADLAEATMAAGGDPRAFLEQAVRTLEHATSLNPRERRAFNNLGWCAMLAADFAEQRGEDQAEHLDRAAERFQQAVAIAPDYAFAHYNLGETYWRRADFEAARGGHDPGSWIGLATTAFEKVISLDPQRADAYWGLANTRKTLALHALIRGQAIEPRVEAGLAHARRAIALNPDLAGPHLVAGRLYAMRARSLHARGSPAEVDLAAARAALGRGGRAEPPLCHGPGRPRVVGAAAGSHCLRPAPGPRASPRRGVALVLEAARGQSRLR